MKWVCYSIFRKKDVIDVHMLPTRTLPRTNSSHKIFVRHLSTFPKSTNR
jgi:hypothetical protein